MVSFSIRPTHLGWMMEESTREIGKRVKCTDAGYFCTQMAANMSASSFMINKRAPAPFTGKGSRFDDDNNLGLMERTTMGPG